MKAKDLTEGVHLTGFLVHIEDDRTTFDIPVVEHVERRCRCHVDVDFSNGDHCQYPADADLQSLDEAERDAAEILRTIRGADL